MKLVCICVMGKSSSVHYLLGYKVSPAENPAQLCITHTNEALNLGAGAKTVINSREETLLCKI